MLYNDFCEDFNVCLNNGDYASANEVLMRELGAILIRRKQDFVHLLNESGVPGEMSDSDAELINTFVNHVPYNKNLMLGASLLVNMQNKELNFDGSKKLSNENVKNGYHVMRKYFVDDYYNTDGPIGSSTLQGAASGGLAGTIAGAIGDIAKATDTVSKGQQKKKYGGQEIAQKREEAKQAMIASALQAKQASYDAQKKAQETKLQTRKIVYIIGGSILAIAVIGLIIYKVKKGK